MEVKVSKDDKLTSFGCITVEEVVEFRHEHVGRHFIFLDWWRPVEKNKNYCMVRYANYFITAQQVV